MYVKHTRSGRVMTEVVNILPKLHPLSWQAFTLLYCRYAHAHKNTHECACTHTNTLGEKGLATACQPGVMPARPNTLLETAHYPGAAEERVPASHKHCRTEHEILDTIGGLCPRQLQV